MTQITPPATPRPAFHPQSSATQSAKRSPRMLPRGRRSSSSLTANVSTLRPAPALPMSPLGPLAPIPQAGTITTPRSTHPPYSPLSQRPRALTSSSTGTGSFYLGGTGGRAQRPRARDRALTVSHAGTRRDGIVVNGDQDTQRETLDDDGEMLPPGRGRSATTSNATPLRSSTTIDANTPAYFGFRNIPSTPTRHGQPRGTEMMLTESRESVL